MTKDLQAISEAANAALDVVNAVKDEIKKVIVGQENMIDKLLLGIVCDGHVLLEGVPGLAKTLTVKTLASTIDATFKRIQFTPDLQSRCNNTILHFVPEWNLRHYMLPDNDQSL